LKPGAPSQLLPDLLPACQLETLDLAHYRAKQDHSMTITALQALQSNYMQATQSARNKSPISQHPKAIPRNNAQKKMGGSLQRSACCSPHL